MSISLLNWRDNPGNIRIQNPDLLTPCLTAVNNSAIAANYNSWGQSCSTWDIMSIIDKNLRIPIYNGNITLYPDSYLISNSKAAQWRNNNFGTGLQTKFSANAVVLDYMPRLHIELMPLRDYLDLIQPTSNPFTWAYNTGLFIANDSSDRGWNFTRKSYGDFYDKSSGYYVVKTISWYTNNNDGSTQTLLSSGGISSNQNNQSYLCKYDVGIPLTITKYPQSTSPIKSDYILGYYSRFFARPAINLTSDDNIYGCGLYTNAGLHQVMLKGAGNMISPDWYWGGSTSSYSYTRRPTALIRYATKEVWERLLNGGGCAWSYDLDKVTAPDDSGLHKPTTPGQPVNPVDDGDGDGDNISDGVTYPIVGYTPTAARYMYALTDSKVKDTSNYLFSQTFLNDVRRLWTNPGDYIIDLSYYPVNFAESRLTFAPALDGSPVYIGNLNSGVTGKEIVGGSTAIYGGYVDITNYYNSYLDYAPNTSISIYIPYIGVRPLDIDLVTGHRVHLMYYLDLGTGQFIAALGLDGDISQDELGRFSGSIGKPLAQYCGNMAIHIPLNGTSQNAYILNSAVQATQILTSAGALAGGVATGNIAGVVGGAGGVVGAVKSPIIKEEVQGTLTPATGLYSPQTAYLIVNRPKTAEPSTFKDKQGYTSCYAGTVSNFTGFLQCAAVEIPATGTMTAEEQQEIINLLTGGIYCG